MSDHLPECGQFCDGQPPKCRGGDCTLCDEVDCICDRLRACEERVWDEAYAAGFNHGRAHGELLSCPISHEHGYEQGVTAAREAVAKEVEQGPLYSVRTSGNAQRGWDAMSRHALSAIDALLERSENPRIPPTAEEQP